ncbi:MAG: alkaline phosphatase family protein [Stellaceae bacterium]
MLPPRLLRCASRRQLPAVSILRARGFQDRHAGYSDRLLEQQFLVNTVNAIMGTRFWGTAAIIIMYDNSDGWYDRQMGPIANSSAATSSNASDEDQFNATGKCGNGVLWLTTTATQSRGGAATDRACRCS